MVAHQLVFASKKHALQQQKAPLCVKKSPTAAQLRANLPFVLTDAQARVVSEIAADMAKSHPMLRLVQGDVGAGKTVVAALAMCHALDAGWQAVLLAPTEILAKQHYNNLQKWFAAVGVNTALLVGKQTAKARRAALADIADGTVQVIVGTHALFSDGVEFAKLALIVVDEQHRFGVMQRVLMAQKGVGTPHQLMMTATPIPRTLAMSVYGDMSLSIIDKLPPNRTPIIIATIDRNRRDEVLERIVVNCQEGKQAYWICPFVAESELDVQSAQLMYDEIKDVLPIRIGLVHGKTKTAEKEQTMAAFAAGQLDLLIATTVVEVGVDVPNASLMVIENAERLGLSQLHQLRGRVGRGSRESFCVLLYQSPLTASGAMRLNIIKASTDGFVLAEKDLQMRGAGELLGTRQTGDMGYYIADIARDAPLLALAADIAENLVNIANKGTASNRINQAKIGELIALWRKKEGGFANA